MTVIRWMLKTIYALAVLALIGSAAWAVAGFIEDSIDPWVPFGYAIVSFVVYLVARALYWFARPA